MRRPQKSGLLRPQTQAAKTMLFAAVKEGEVSKKLSRRFFPIDLVISEGGTFNEDDLAGAGAGIVTPQRGPDEPRIRNLQIHELTIQRHDIPDTDPAQRMPH